MGKTEEEKIVAVPIFFTIFFNGSQISMTDAQDRITVFEYDELNRRIKTIFADGTSAAVEYDKLGRKTAEYDQAGKKTEYEYDILGRLLKVILPSPDGISEKLTTTYAYDNFGNRISQTDALGRTTSFEYDKLGRMTKKIMPDGTFETCCYNANSNLISKTDANNNEVTFEYDTNNRLVTKIYPDSAQDTFTYYLNGQKKSMNDAHGITTYQYDNRGRLTLVTNPGGKTIAYEYDANSNRTKTITEDKELAYIYDELNRLVSVNEIDPDTQESTEIASYKYTDVGSRESVTYANGTKAEYHYDDLNRLTELTNKKIDTDEIISSYIYTLGLSGNRTSVIENDGSEISYTYDNFYRLTKETRAGTNPYSISYIYDEVGNRLSMTKDAEVTLYDYNINDQLTIETAPEGITAYEYDDNGNTIRKTAPEGITDYVYNYNNKLITADAGGDVTSYIYSADGNRVSKTDYYGTTNYIVDTNNSTGYAQVLEELDTGNNCMVYYTYGDDLISQTQGSLINYYHYDGHGSVRALTNAPAMVTDTYTYDAFGNEIASTGDTPNNYKYCGEQYDPNVGFYYLRARYYDPAVGRFTTTDPYRGSAYDPPSLHKYLYCHGNPVGNIDPSGLRSLTELLATVTIITILANTAISVWAFNTAANYNFKFDGILLSARFDISHVVVGGGGIDLLFDLKSKKFFCSIVGETGLDPLSTFKKHRGGGFTVLAGLVFGLSNPNSLSGLGVSACWPTSVLKLMPIIGGTSNVWGTMTQFAKNVLHHKGATVGFGKSSSGPATMFFGTSYRSFSSMVSFNSNFINVEEIIPDLKEDVDRLKGIASNLASLGTDVSSFSKNADKALSFLP
ncbi:MAG: RHS repeat-associated core domain-containing protein [Candidatus Auribacterota bacterium]|nr:RHS repeat-associated core domain-containing protein [Candidatus Auribacterota bacterium]